MREGGSVDLNVYAADDDGNLFPFYWKPNKTGKFPIKSEISHFIELVLLGNSPIKRENFQ